MFQGTVLRILVIAIQLFAVFSSKAIKDPNNPILTFQPIPPKKWEEKTLIWYKGGENFKSWTNKLNKFLQVYEMPELTKGRSFNIIDCEYGLPPPKGRVCRIDLKKGFGPCIKENAYGYHKHTPCVFLKLDAPIGWNPEYYTDVSELPDAATNTVREYLRTMRPIERDSVWVSCDGEGPVDIENIGPIKYYPRPGFPGYFFPRQKDEGYLSPIVAVHFEKPTRGLITNVQCKIWVRNFTHDITKNIGAVHFELLVDD